MFCVLVCFLIIQIIVNSFPSIKRVLSVYKCTEKEVAFVLSWPEGSDVLCLFIMHFNLTTQESKRLGAPLMAEDCLCLPPGVMLW